MRTNNMKELNDAILADVALRAAISERRSTRFVFDMACADSLNAARSDARRIDANYEAWLLK